MNDFFYIRGKKEGAFFHSTGICCNLLEIRFSGGIAKN